MAVLLRNHRPLYFFSLIALALLAADAVYARGLGRRAAARRTAPLVHGAGGRGRAARWPAALVVLGVVLNAVSAGFRELVALARRPR